MSNQLHISKVVNDYEGLDKSKSKQELKPIRPADYNLDIFKIRMLSEYLNTDPYSLCLALKDLDQKERMKYIRNELIANGYTKMLDFGLKRGLPHFMRDDGTDQQIHKGFEINVVEDKRTEEEKEEEMKELADKFKFVLTDVEKPHFLNFEF